VLCPGGQLAARVLRRRPAAAAGVVVAAMGRRSGETEEERAARKAAHKAAQEAKRAKREGRAAPGVGRKPCALCQRPRDLLVRCAFDATGAHAMVCGACWASDRVSGGRVDGDGAVNPHYVYGGLWKNHHACVSGRGRVPASAGVGGSSGAGDGGGGGAAGGGPAAGANEGGAAAGEEAAVESTLHRAEAVGGAQLRALLAADAAADV